MQLPPLNQVAAALRRTTEVLARELVVPTREPPRWTEFEWRIARAASAMHGVSALLHGRLRWQGPDQWWRFLSAQRDQSVGRHRQIARLLQEIDAQGRTAGVALVPLKGAALHALGLYAAGERPMGDIDLLVRQGDAAAVSRVLGACGYSAAFSTHRHHVYQPPMKKPVAGGILGEHVDNPIKIEVHFRIAERLPVRPADITQIVLPRTMHAGFNDYPCAASLMLHLLLHAAGNIRARALRLVQLHDIALLAGRLTLGDWEELLAMRPDGGVAWWASAPLTLTNRYYAASVPQHLLAAARFGCPRLLRRCALRQELTDVSWSNIRVRAFPGLEWSRTPMDAIAFMSSRIWPSREARSELKEGAAQIPDSGTVPWYGISHGARILRWVFTRPPRVQTLLSVRAALARCDDEPMQARWQ
jgi:putative nucleotidyltransferase-like protein